jgi:pSer/pThr/pTyr-binding forkhead associated (FHA) protein
MSQKQFILKKVNGAWTITQSPDAKNITNINGKPLTEPTILNNGDTISLGKSGQVPIKVNFN